MSEGPTFRDDLYVGTASYYDEFRLRYPDALVDDLCVRTSTNGSGRLLDLACGPGTATFALADRFADVVAVDLEPETVEFARRKADALGVHNVHWRVGRAEDVDRDARFDVVTIGTAFHRLDRDRVAELAIHWLRSGGYIALLWSDTPLQGDAAWQHRLVEIVVDWIDQVESRDRVPATLAGHIEQRPHTTVLQDAGFVDIDRHEFTEVHYWTVPELAGLLYSTSLLPRVVLGERVDEFEVDLRDRMLELEPSGVFRQSASFAYDLAYRAAG